jgi:hypothetical protein
LSDEERSHRDIASTNQISMERIMTVLTDKQQTFVGPILFAGLPTDGARLRSVVGINLNRHAVVQQGFIGDHAMQLGKGPFGESSIGFPLLLARLFAFASFGSFTNVCQVLQSDQAMWVLFNDVFGNDMMSVLLQPSLSSADRQEATLCRTSAFLLQALSQSCRMVGFGSDSLARMEGACPLGCGSHRKVAHAHINTNHLCMGL